MIPTIAIRTGGSCGDVGPKFHESVVHFTPIALDCRLRLEIQKSGRDELDQPNMPTGTPEFYALFLSPSRLHANDERRDLRLEGDGASVVEV